MSTPSDPPGKAHQPLSQRISTYHKRIEGPQAFHAQGRVVRMVGLTLEAKGCQSAIGSRCLVSVGAEKYVEAEVVGFAGDRLFLMPTGDIQGISMGAKVIPCGRPADVAVGEALLGRVLDGGGNPLDGKGPLTLKLRMPLLGEAINPLARAPIRQQIDVGVTCINGLLTVGRGQRMGLFAGSGVGKSVLLGMMTKFTDADVVVVGLIGERGREVKEFIEDILGPEGMRKAVVVAAPADNPPLLRLHGAMLATSIAEYFRKTNKNVLLLMDSLTRFAQAQRELALAIGEPPATKGYPPSVFAKLPQLVERVGNGIEGGGSITAFYTVLTEGDDQQDPIADASRAILDGHVILSRQLAESGHYPAIDVGASISRAMDQITDESHQLAARRFKSVYSSYHQARDLISVGAYVKGSDPQIDLAIKSISQLQDYLRQDTHQAGPLTESIEQMQQIVQGFDA